MNKEQIYDSEIAPLMQQIIAICNAKKIAMVASFSIPTEESDALMCTSFTPDESGDLPERFSSAVRALGMRTAQPLILRTERSDGIVAATIIS